MDKKNYTPQQIDFAMRYYMPNSSTYGNAYASAKAAGYSEETSQTITARDFKWMASIYSDIFGKSTDKKNLVNKAKKVLDKSLDSEDERIAQDTAKFIAKTDPEFSEKSDVTTNGESINPYTGLSTEELRKLSSANTSRNQTPSTD